MLQLVLGIAGTGKTTWILKQLQTRANKGLASIFLVPEQFSSSAETLVLETLGDAGSAFVEVVSFRTLAERILRFEGKNNLPVLSDAGRAVFVRRALSRMQAELKTFGRKQRGTAFCNLCAQTLAELKTAGATPEALREIARAEDNPKFSDLALIFETYEAAIAGSAMDPEDRLNLAAAHASPAFFENKACYIDNFDGFTAPEYQVLGSLLFHCPAVCVCLCCNHEQESEGGLGLFSPVRLTATRLKDLAQKAGVETAPSILLPTPLRSGESCLHAVNLIMTGTVPGDLRRSPQLTLSSPADTAEEVRLVAAQMRLLAEDGVPYSRMALVCRDISTYEAAVRSELALFGIPWFCDAPDSIEFTAPVAFLRAALGLLQKGLVSQPILSLLKTGLCGFPEEALAALDNYVYTWQPKAADWRKPFENNPRGFLQEMDEEAVSQLALAEGLREQVVPALENFIRRAKHKDARGLSIELYRLMDHFSAAEHLEESALLLETNGEYPWAERSRRAFDLTMDMLDEMAHILGSETVTAGEYDELFLLLVRSTDFGQAPQMLESAIFTSADRMRLSDPDYCFVLGLCEGEFPMQVGYSGLLNHNDRDCLVQHEIKMPGSFQNRMLLEEMFLYRALTSARKGLHLSWPGRKNGVPTTMSSALEPLQRLLQPEPLQVDSSAFTPTPAAAFSHLCETLRDDPAEAANLAAALAQSGDTFSQSALSLLHTVEAPANFQLQNTSFLHRLTGNTLNISPTRAERYFTCRFSYFMEHVLKVRPRRKAQLSPLESGTFVHYVLEHVLNDVKTTLSACNNQSLQELTNRHADEFIAANLPENSLRTQHLLERIKEATCALLIYLRDWAQNSDFEIDALELPIGEGGVPPLELAGEQGEKLRVVGKVDRVDVLRKDGKTYLCVLDYKTGTRQFDISEVFYGLNTQMLVYMDILCKQGGKRYENAIPAGILYLSADPAPKSGTRNEREGPLFQLDGLLLDDPAILAELDKDKSGVFLPVKYKKDGSPKAAKQLADLSRIGGLSLHIEEMLAQMAGGVQNGTFDAKPLVRQNGARPCDYCPYRAACRHEDGQRETAMQRQDEWISQLGADPSEKEGAAHE